MESEPTRSEAVTIVTFALPVFSVVTLEVATISYVPVAPTLIVNKPDVELIDIPVPPLPDHETPSRFPVPVSAAENCSVEAAVPTTFTTAGETVTVVTVAEGEPVVVSTAQPETDTVTSADAIVTVATFSLVEFSVAFVQLTLPVEAVVC